MNSLAVDCAKYLIIVPVICVIYLAWKLEGQKRKNYVLVLLVGGLVSIIAAKLAGLLYDDPRPLIKDGVVPLFQASRDNGFPSDHTLLAAFIGFATVYYSKRLGVILLILAAIIGWARVYSGVHHFNDVLGSFIITAVAAWATNLLVKPYTKSPAAVTKHKSDS